MTEVELLLLVVEVAAGLVSGRQGDRVDAERGHAERAADLPEPVLVAHLVDVPDRVSVALDDLVSHRTGCYSAQAEPAFRRSYASAPLLPILILRMADAPDIFAKQYMLTAGPTPLPPASRR